MRRVAVFVDAGYFWVQCSNILFGEKRSRSEIGLNTNKLRSQLRKMIVDEFNDADLLRIYWYDGLGSTGQPSSINIEIGLLDDFKMRYGTINSENQQKGVDGLIIADLIGLAQNKAITDALLISGDADLAPGVAAAQTLGIRIHRLEMHSPQASSTLLRSEVDKNRLWDESSIKSFISGLQSTKNELCAEKMSLQEIAQTFINTLPEEQRPTKSNFEKAFDKKLLGYARSCREGEFLESTEIYELRDAVRKICNLSLSDYK